MEELNNRQIVLLTMLTSFVVSIATGIITVAMLEEAPQTVTQTVNRVVERTIERVVTGTSTPLTPSVAPVTTVTKEVTIYAKEDDLVIAAVEKNQPRIVRIFSMTAATDTDPTAIGFVVSRDGLIATERKNISVADSLSEKYQVNIMGIWHEAVPVTSETADKSALAFLRVNDLKSTETLDAVSFGSQPSSKVAQTIIVLGGSDGSGVFKASISRLLYQKSDGASTTTQTVSAIETEPKMSSGNHGGLVVNLDGQVVGIVVSGESSGQQVIYPAARILELVGAVSAEMRASGDTPAGSVS